MIYNMQQYNQKPVLRGGIYYIRPAQGNTGSEMNSNRYAVVVSNNIINKTSTAISIVYLTRSQKRKHFKTHVSLVVKGENAQALCEQLHTVDKNRIAGFIENVSPKTMEEINQALFHHLAI